MKVHWDSVIVKKITVPAWPERTVLTSICLDALACAVLLLLISIKWWCECEYVNYFCTVDGKAVSRLLAVLVVCKIDLSPISATHTRYTLQHGPCAWVCRAV